MTIPTHPQTERLDFQAEIKQLLDIVARSLYADNEVFARELVSNASDALEKLRHLQLTEHEVYEQDAPLQINVTTDPTAKTLTIEDSGVGLTRDELIANLGTIAHSGSKAFLEGLHADAAKPDHLIGQFGVGFYSAFMVAKSVTVYTRSWRPNEPGYVWASDGTGSYTIAEADNERRGARIVIELRDDCSDFASDWKIRDVLERHSVFVSFPIYLNGDRINTVEALWLRQKSEITDEQYAEFYRFQGHAYDTPRLRLHFAADAPLSLHTLLFVPETNPEKVGLPHGETGVALYSRRVLIDARPKDLLPNWLRFLRGVVDSEDIPLNLSREATQDRALVAKLKSLLTVRVLRFLDETASRQPQEYEAFYREFAQYIKEGAATDFSQRESLSKLLRYESSSTAPGTLTSFNDYVARMKPGQSEIYYLIGPSRRALESGPYLEGLRAHGFEVLFCFEPVDEYVMSNIINFAEKRIIAADHANVQLPSASTEAPAENEGANPDQPATESMDGLIAWLREMLGERVTEVVVSDRLVDSPVLAISTDRLTSPNVRRMMRAMNRAEGQAAVRVKLEINPRHRVIQRLDGARTTEPETAALIAQQLLDNALLSAGLLDDPAAMVARLNQILTHI
ncbi:MAG: molecular chaperone HtpG [Gemmatimonadetes bacterium]|nr:molecular chaperone HtpG [Gemmatimonadota bacterium]